MREWIIRHPEMIGAFLAALVAFTALEVFEIGCEIGTARALSGEVDRFMSESLGG